MVKIESDLTPRIDKLHQHGLVDMHFDMMRVFKELL